MHSEFYIISEEVADKLNKAKANGQRIIAVGTTSTRTLEANMKKYGKFKATSENTEKLSKKNIVSLASAIV